MRRTSPSRRCSRRSDSRPLLADSSARDRRGALDPGPSSWLTFGLNRRDDRSCAVNCWGGVVVYSLFLRVPAARGGAPRPGVVAIGPDAAPLVEPAPALGRFRGQRRPYRCARGHLVRRFPMAHGRGLRSRATRLIQLQARRRRAWPQLPIRSRLGRDSCRRERSAHRTCMNGHQPITKDSEQLASIRDSAAGDRPVRWIRVRTLPGDACYAHIARGDPSRGPVGDRRLRAGGRTPATGLHRGRTCGDRLREVP